MVALRRTGIVLVSAALLGIAVVLVMVVSGWGTQAAEKYAKYNFSQTQSQLSVRLESSQKIKASQWSYAGPLDNYRDCSARKFKDLPANIKGEANVAVSDKNPKVASAKLPIQPSDNNKYYCLLAEGHAIFRLIDYNPPAIRLEGSNHIIGRDVYKGPYGPSGVVDSGSWEAAVFDVSRRGGDYACDAGNAALVFRPVKPDSKYVSRYDWGNDNHITYNLPGGHVQFNAEFFEALEKLFYAEPETDPSLIPFDQDNQYTETFTDNIHLCHRVDDPQGNTSYKLMRLDIGGPAIKVIRSGNTLRASSPAVDLDADSWRYYKAPHRRNSSVCEHLDHPPEPTGESATVNNVAAGEIYCFWALDEQGNRNTRLVQVEESGLKIMAPTPIYRPGDPSPSQEQEQQPAEEEPAAEAGPPPVQQRPARNDNASPVPPVAGDPVTVPPMESVGLSTETTATETDPGDKTAPQTSAAAADPQEQPLAHSTAEDAGFPRYLLFSLVGVASVMIVLILVFLIIGMRGSRR